MKDRLGGPLYALRLLAFVIARPLFLFVDQAVLGHSPLNPKE